jgi:glycosyltransferase involved in cell wall biosynthesis
MKFSVIASSPTLELSGANVLVANLLDELSKEGVKTGWIVTDHAPKDDAEWLGSRRFPISRLPPTKLFDVSRRQQLLLSNLESASPCIYLPNFDFDMACAIPALSLASRGVLIMHCDDPVYYNFIERQGDLFDAIVCVSEFLANKLRSRHPELSERIVHIPFGIEIPDHPALKKRGERSSKDPLRVAYCGRLSFHQKRIQDLARIINRCHADSLPVEFHIAGAGPDEEEFFASISVPFGQRKVHRHGFLPNAGVLSLLEQSDVLLMTSDFEGLPMVLLEAMSRGCIPVVTAIQSGIGEVVRDGESGYLHSVGDVESFVTSLARLTAAPDELDRIQRAAYARIKDGEFTLSRAATAYRQLFALLTGGGLGLTAPRSGLPIVPVTYRLATRLGGAIARLFASNR